MGSRSPLDRSKKAQRFPTRGQHGSKMGSKRGTKIGPRGFEIWSRKGLRLESLSDLNMDPKWTPKPTPTRGRQASPAGRAAHHAIVAMCDTADSLTWRVLERLFMRWATFIWSHSAHCRPAQCTCPPPSAASRPHLRNRGESTSWPQSYDSMLARENCRRSVRQKLRRA